MRASLKVTLSLLISLLAFSAFSLIAYSGLFNIIESNFYHPRIKNEFQKTVEDLGEKARRYHEINIERYSSMLQKGFITRSFLTNQVAEDIKQREEYFSKLRETYPDFLFCRLLAVDGKRIHYSTYEQDIKMRERDRIIYHEIGELEDLDVSKVLIGEGEVFRLAMDSTGRRFIYSFPIKDDYQVFKGIALFYVRVQGLQSYLLNMPGYTYGEFVPVSYQGFVANVPRETFSEQDLLQVIAEVASSWQEHTANDSYSVLLGLTLAGQRYMLFTSVDRLYGNFGVLVPLSMFEIAPSMKMTLMISFFLTIFLVVFLLFNLKQDPLIVASQRIKRFQIDFLQDFVESKESVNWERWKRDLALKAPVLKKEIKNGLGRIKKSREKEIDELIDKSWDEIITILGGKAGVEIEDKTDLGRIEAMLQRVVDSGHLVITGGQAERVEPTEPGEEVEEAEAVEEAEEVEELEAVEEAEEVEELEAVEEAEEVEELEAVEEAEEVEEAEAVEEAEEVEEAVEEVEIKEAEEVLEELEVLPEIEPLPPEPYEELEALPGAGEEGEEEVGEDMESYQVPPTTEEISSQEPARMTEQKGVVTGRPAVELAKKSKIQTYSLSDLKQSISRMQTSITVENGVYRIGDEVYEQRRRGSKPELQSLADTVLGAPKEARIRVELNNEKVIPVSTVGFDFDGYIKQFKDPEKQRTQFMALVDISKRIEAVSVAVLVKEQDAFTPQLTLGLGEESAKKLKFGLDDPLVKSYFKQKKTLLINEEIGKITQLKGRFTSNDLKYIKKAVFFPSHYRNRDAVLFFGFACDEDLRIDSILNRLNVSIGN
jgi:hypothetical protein